jgi:hypothetical protein
MGIYRIQKIWAQSPGHLFSASILIRLAEAAARALLRVPHPFSFTMQKTGFEEASKI